MSAFDRGKHLLFDRHGHHVAVVMDRQLFDRRGRYIGQYLSQYEVFVDRQGRYLGEVVRSDRLLYNLLSPYCRPILGCSTIPIIGFGQVGKETSVSRLGG